ncbi:MAG TPA: DUF3426 domain-containing protein [Paucimonas sp.]|nr:DUF3426 domain-containing protein [Paucimonas sp.]
MALATRCPHCHTTFRVAHDQLKLRAGLVRCGACKEIFNGIEHLLPQDKPAAAPAAAPAPSLQPPAPPEPAIGPSPVSAAPAPPSPEAETEPEAPAGTAATPTPDMAEAQPPASPGREHEGRSGAPPAEAAKPRGDDQAIPDFFDLLELDAKAKGKAAPNAAAGAPAAPTSPAGEETLPRPETEYEEHEEPVDPLTRMTLMDFRDRSDGNDEPATTEATDADAAGGGDADHLDQVIDELQSRPDRRKPPQRRPRNMQHLSQEPDEAADLPDEELAELASAEDDANIEDLSFVKKARRRERFGPLVRWTLGLGSVLLALVLLGQGIYAYRNQLAARLPKAKPLLIKACAMLDCRISLPMQIEAISIEANELQTTAAGKDILVLTTVLRNRSSMTQAWPNLELTLKDANGKPLVRRVFLPREYLLAPEDVARGFASSTEQQIKLVFNLAQPDSSGYEVAIFYP